jgi:SAM-dependent methyltransferase
MSKRLWVIPFVVLGAALLHRTLRRVSLEQAAANVRAFDLPSAGLYDALVASVLTGFYARVADEVSDAHPSGTFLEVGSGPGRLAVRLARAAPGVTITGVDISSAMVERASRRVAEEGLADRVRFEVGDVGALPFPEGSFDGVVSTLSLHHWPDPARGLAEIQRVLKPGGEAWIYDLAHWLWRPAHGESRLRRFIEPSPLGSGTVEVFRWPGSVPAFVRLRLRRDEGVGSGPRSERPTLA